MCVYTWVYFELHEVPTVIDRKTWIIKGGQGVSVSNFGIGGYIDLNLYVGNFLH